MRKSFAVIFFALAGLAALWGGITLASQQIGGGSAGLSGPYPSDFNLQDDICLHDQFIWGGPPPPHNRTLDVAVNGTNLQMSGPSPVVTVFDETFDGTNINAQGTGTVAGFPNTAVTFVGTLNNGQITGTYTFGNDNPPGQGGLPPCDDDDNPQTPDRPHPAVYGIKPKPVTPTPTGTPPKRYSIIVIKLNDDTLQPVPGWQMNLYTGEDCQGNPFDNLTTDADGMVDFENLDPGTYSVEEKTQPGWNAVGPTCENVTLPGVAGTLIPPCPVSPNQPHPQPGCDIFGSAARVNVRFNATGAVTGASLGGPVQIARENKASDKDQDGLDEINTEMVFMELTGGGITVRESPTQHSDGVIEEQTDTTGGLDFPADSFFDVFFEVEVAGLTLHNDTPFRLGCKIDEVPPYKCFYEPPIKTPIDLLNADGVKIAKLIHGLHLPIPPNEEVIIFTNRPKFTPTPTPTRTPTPTPGGVTPTPTNPPPNGECTKTDQDVTFQNKVWDQWKCIPNPPNVPFNRVDIFVGSAQQDPVLSAAHFVCQSTGEKVDGVFKAHKNGVNPGTNLPNSDVWSGEFIEKCVPGAAGSGVNVYVQAVSPAVHPTVLQVAFTDNQEATATPTRTATPQAPPTATPTPRRRDGDANKDGTTNPVDATLVLQFSAGLLASVNPSSDANDDGTTNPVDGTLILQFSAGLIDALPV